MTNIFEIREQILRGETTARKEVEKAIEKAKASADFNALTSLTEERALSRADEIDAKIKAGEEVGELAGVPCLS